jgi:hypothetical protein
LVVLALNLGLKPIFSAAVLPVALVQLFLPVCLRRMPVQLLLSLCNIFGWFWRHHLHIKAWFKAGFWCIVSADGVASVSSFEGSASGFFFFGFHRFSVPSFSY